MIWKFLSEIAGTLILVAIFVLPWALLGLEAACLIISNNKIFKRIAGIIDAVVLILGIILEWLYIEFVKNATEYDWQEQLYNAQKHRYIFSGAMLTVVTIFIVGIVGYIILQYVPMSKIPPLVAVFSISAMYMGIIQLMVLTFQVIGLNFPNIFTDIYLYILPICCIFVAARVIRAKVMEWNNMNVEMSKIDQDAVLSFSKKVLQRAEMWPVVAIVMMLPLLGVLIIVLVLFGQAPDAVIKAWTETSDWALSAKQGPQNIYYDEHYLCTVAAGGHRKVVKPIRKGIRHGHEVVVNRQLCIANAFEEVIQEKTPRLHRVVRGFYDKYGFPVARLIKEKWIADVIYFIMKPLEWIFLIVLYCVDVHPENRIAVQYTGK